MNAAESLVIDQGFAATSIDSILGAAGASKGAFFHHFESKDALGEAILRRYADAEAALLNAMLAQAESGSDDPATQLVRFIHLFEEQADGIADNTPGCLFVSFVYEKGPSVDQSELIVKESIELWQTRILEKLEAAAETRPELDDVDLPALADQVFTIFEGAFVLVRATGDRSRLRGQLTHLRRYLALLLDVDFEPRLDGSR